MIIRTVFLIFIFLFHFNAFAFTEEIAKGVPGFFQELSRYEGVKTNPEIDQESIDVSSFTFAMLSMDIGHISNVYFVTARVTNEEGKVFDFECYVHVSPYRFMGRGWYYMEAYGLDDFDCLLEDSQGRSVSMIDRGGSAAIGLFKLEVDRGDLNEVVGN